MKKWRNWSRRKSMSENKEALLILPDMDICGGGERVSYKTGQKLAERDYNIDILTNAFDTPKGEILDKLEDAYGESEKFRGSIREEHVISGQRVKKFVRSRYKESLQWRKAEKLHEKNSYDLVVTHYSNIHFMPEFEGAEVVYFLGPGPKLGSAKLRAALKLYLTPYRVFNKLTKRKEEPENYSFISVSEFSSRIFQERFPKIDFRKINPPVDIESFRYSGEEKQDRILNFSRISPDKANHRFIEAVARLDEDTREGWKFRIVGKLRESERGYYEKLEEKIQNEDLEDTLEIRKNLSFDDLKHELKTSKLYVHTAVDDTMPSTPIEAMAAGNSILVHRSGGPWIDVAEEGEHGEGWSETGELAEKLQEFVQSGDLKPEKNIERAKNFSEEKFNQEVEELLDKVEEKENG
jgi:glycosyltransferase involved in cell wall biosynthesis